MGLETWSLMSLWADGESELSDPSGASLGPALVAQTAQYWPLIGQQRSRDSLMANIFCAQMCSKYFTDNSLDLSLSTIY